MLCFSWGGLFVWRVFKERPASSKPARKKKKLPHKCCYPLSKWPMIFLGGEHRKLVLEIVWISLDELFRVRLTAKDFWIILNLKFRFGLQKLPPCSFHPFGDFLVHVVKEHCLGFFWCWNNRKRCKNIEVGKRTGDIREDTGSPVKVALRWFFVRIVWHFRVKDFSSITVLFLAEPKFCCVTCASCHTL